MVLALIMKEMSYLLVGMFDDLVRPFFVFISVILIFWLRCLF